MKANSARRFDERAEQKQKITDYIASTVHPFLKDYAGELRVYYTNRELYDLDLRDVLLHDLRFAVAACLFIFVFSAGRLGSIVSALGGLLSSDEL